MNGDFEIAKSLNGKEFDRLNKNESSPAELLRKI